jgi:hypothetical protein
MNYDDKITDCPNGYTKDNFATNFFVNDKELEVCSHCNHFCYKDGIATCDHITGISK